MLVTFVTAISYTVLVLVGVGAVTVTIAEVDIPLNTVTGAGVLVEMVVLIAEYIISMKSYSAFKQTRQSLTNYCHRGSRSGVSHCAGNIIGSI